MAGRYASVIVAIAAVTVLVYVTLIFASFLARRIGPSLIDGIMRIMGFLLIALAVFTDNDDDKNGSLSVEEMIKEKLADFKTADSNGDGRLSLEEVKKYYDSKG